MTASPDNIYFNIDVSNPEGIIDKPAKFSANRVDAVLNRSGDYRVAVVRFTIPTSRIPIRHTQDVMNEFTVSIGKGGINFTEQVLSSDINNGTTEILSYQDITDAINSAWTRAFNQLKIAIPALTSTEAPKLVFFESSALFLIKLELAYYTDAIDIYCNDRMWEFFFFPSIYYPDPTVIGYVNDNKLQYKDNGVNTDLTLGYTFFYQPYQTSSLFEDLKRLYFETDRMPITGELIGGQDDKTQTFLTDFDPIQTPLQNKTRLSFFPQGPYRWYDLNGDSPLKDIDISIKYSVSTLDEQIQLTLRPAEFANIKLLFRHKDLNM
jgi:hypothetical protein